jgi:hypothetical protein
MAIEIVVFLLLHLLKIYSFSYRIILSAVGGVIIELLSFVILCLAVQRAVNTQDEKARKAKMQLSYYLRMLIQAAWVVLAFIVSFLNVIAAAAPLLFPTLIIFFLQRRGTLVEPSERKNPEPSDEDEDEEDHLGSFEI